MNTHLVVVCDVDNGPYMELDGMYRGMRGIFTNGEPNLEGLSVEDRIHGTKIWACEARDVPIVVDRVSREWVGHEIKIFNLVELHSRVPGELRSKQLSVDGVFPT